MRGGRPRLRSAPAPQPRRTRAGAGSQPATCRTAGTRRPQYPLPPAVPRSGQLCTSPIILYFLYSAWRTIPPACRCPGRRPHRARRWPSRRHSRSPASPPCCQLMLGRPADPGGRGSACPAAAARAGNLAARESMRSLWRCNFCRELWPRSRVSCSLFCGLMPGRYVHDGPEFGQRLHLQLLTAATQHVAALSMHLQCALPPTRPRPAGVRA